MQVDKIMTARKLAYSTPSDEAVRLAKAPITKANAMQLLTSFLANGKPPDLIFRLRLGGTYCRSVCRAQAGSRSTPRAD